MTETIRHCVACGKNLEDVHAEGYPFYLKISLDGQVHNCCKNNECRFKTYEIFTSQKDTVDTTNMVVEICSVFTTPRPTKILDGHGFFKCSSIIDIAHDPNEHIIQVKIAVPFAIKNIEDNKKELMVDQIVERFKKELNTIFS